jgi:hypothetical protein
MRNLLGVVVGAAFALAWLSGPLSAQAPRGQGGTAAAARNYVTVVMEIDVDRPAAEVWKRVGKYCDIEEWFGIACTITSGTDGEIGSVRSVANEVMVGKSELSYTYAQPPPPEGPYNMYHGTVEARPVTAKTSKIIYTLMYDNSNLADDAAKQQDMERRRTTFTRALESMKILAEGGTLPPQPARGRRGGGRGGAPGAGGGRGN